MVTGNSLIWHNSHFSPSIRIKIYSTKRNDSSNNIRLFVKMCHIKHEHEAQLP